MKVLLRVLVLLFGITGLRASAFAQSGWFWQNPLPQGNDLRAAATDEGQSVSCYPDVDRPS